MSNNNELENNKEEILDFISRKPWIFLGVLTIIGLSIRLYFFPNDLPPTGDAIGYFWYANDMSILGQFPELSYKENFSPPPNNGWPANAISIDNMFNNITGTINNIVYPFC